MSNMRLGLLAPKPQVLIFSFWSNQELFKGSEESILVPNTGAPPKNPCFKVQTPQRKTQRETKCSCLSPSSKPSFCVLLDTQTQRHMNKMFTRTSSFMIKPQQPPHGHWYRTSQTMVHPSHNGRVTCSMGKICKLCDGKNNTGYQIVSTEWAPPFGSMKHRLWRLTTQLYIPACPFLSPIQRPFHAIHSPTSNALQTFPQPWTTVVSGLYLPVES